MGYKIVCPACGCPIELTPQKGVGSILATQLPVEPPKDKPPADKPPDDQDLIDEIIGGANGDQK